MIIFAPYGVALTFEIPIPKADDNDFAEAADWTPDTGDVKLSKAGGNVANTTNLPAAVGGTGSRLWSFTLTSTEMQTARATVQIIDDAVIHDAILIYTYGHASAHITGNFNHLDASVAGCATPAQVASAITDASLATSSALAAAKAVVDVIVTRTDVNTSTRSAPGDAMTLTSGERTAVANEVEAQIIDDTDSEKVLQAIIDKIAAANPSLEDLTLGAIASAVRTELATELARIDALVSSRATPAQVNEQADTALADAGVNTTRMARLDVDVSSRLATGSYVAPDNASAAAAAAAAGNASDILEEMTEDDEGLRFTEHSLEMAPAGEGGGGDCPTAEEIVEAIEQSGLGITVVNGTHVAPDGTKLTLVQGETYLHSLSNAIRFTLNDSRLANGNASDGTTVKLLVQPRNGGTVLSVQGTIVSISSGVAVVRFEMTAAQSAALPAGIGSCRYDIEWTIAGVATNVLVTVVEGICTVRRQSI